MKPEINLLSPEARGLRMALIAAHRVNKLLYAILGGLAVVLMVYGASWWANKIILSSLDNRLLQQGKERVEIEQSIRSLNSTVQAIDARITANPRWAIHIQDVLTVLPSGIQIMKLELSESQSVLLITTKAASGDVVVQSPERHSNYEIRIKRKSIGAINNHEGSKRRRGSSVPACP